MGDLTPKLDLYLPGGGSTGTIPDEPADIDKLNGNFRTLDATAGYFVCTSTTRPAEPYPGQPIYETDTQMRRIYVNGVWTKETSDWVTPTLLTGWAVPGAEYLPIAYRREGSNIRFRGAATGAVAGDPLFTIEPNYRLDLPAGKTLFVQVANGATASTTTRLGFRANGQVVAIAGTAPNFDSLTFPASGS